MTTKPKEWADGTLSSCLEEGAVEGREGGERREGGRGSGERALFLEARARERSQVQQ